MTLKTKIQSDVDNVFLNTDHFAESVTYTPAGESGSAISAIVDRGPLAYLEVDGVSQGNMELTECRVFVSKTDLTAPARGDTVLITNAAGADETWRVDGWEYDEAGWWLNCKLVTSRELSAPAARRRV